MHHKVKKNISVLQIKEFIDIETRVCALTVEKI